MPDVPDQYDELREPDLPPALRDRLIRVGGATPRVPDRVDDAVLAMARRRFARVRRQRMVLRRVAAATAAAAAVAMFVWVASRPGPSAPIAQVDVRAPAGAATATAGRVTILDAFRLAREIESGARPGREWDANGDGIVDRRDVDALAMKAVSVSGGRA